MYRYIYFIVLILRIPSTDIARYLAISRDISRYLAVSRGITRYHVVSRGVTRYLAVSRVNDDNHYNIRTYPYTEYVYYSVTSALGSN